MAWGRSLFELSFPADAPYGALLLVNHAVSHQFFILFVINT